MSTEGAPRRVVVRRITVDERLANDLIRLASCRLAEGVEVFFDRDGDWGSEREIWAEPKTYARKMGVPASIAPPWATLEEGQVFVSGEFEVVGDRAAPDYLRVSRGRNGGVLTWALLPAGNCTTTPAASVADRVGPFHHLDPCAQTWLA